MDEADKIGGRERPVVFRKLTSATRAIDMLLFCADEWTLEEEYEILADEVRPHLAAAARALERFVERRRELIALHREDRLDEVIDDSLRDLRYSLR